MALVPQLLLLIKESMSKVIIKSSDNKKFEIDEVVARKSQLLKNIIDGMVYIDFRHGSRRGNILTECQGNSFGESCLILSTL